MTSSQKEFLVHYGWNEFFENQLAEIEMQLGKFRVARVINEERNLYRLQFSNDEILLSNIAGKLKFQAHGRNDYPAVGDWVLAEIPEHSERAVIRFIFKRKTALLRKQVGSVSDIQILATNVDTVFITTSLNADLNLSRLERYLTFAWDSGATPVILLTKTDLFTEDIAAVISDLKQRFDGVEIHALTKDNFLEADFFKNYLGVGSTSVFVGSSGVGKSTISNFLTGREDILTAGIREDDDKGLHTTTSRSLYKTIHGGLIIDSPGMRELQFAGHLDGLETQFSDIEELIRNCRYTNCLHETEIDCAIQFALQNDILDALRWKSYKKIAGEVRHSMRKENRWMLAEDRKVWKKRTKETREKNKVW